MCCIASVKIEFASSTQSAREPAFLAKYNFQHLHPGPEQYRKLMTNDDISSCLDGSLGQRNPYPLSSSRQDGKGQLLAPRSPAQVELEIWRMRWEIPCAKCCMTR